MATSKAQRIGIWIIAGFMAVGTIGSFAIIVLANSNAQQDQERVKQLTAEYTAATNKQSKELSDKYFATLSEHAKRAAPFDATTVTELKTEDIVIGTGDDITEASSFNAYYVGWKPDGTVFDSSIEGTALKEPFEVAPGGVIQGWTKGAAGMKVGGIRELTIPSNLAYGEAGSGELIPANTPLKFVIMIIPAPEPIEMPQELLNYYQTGRLQ